MIDSKILSELIDKSTTYNTSDQLTTAHFDRIKFAQLVVEEAARVAEQKNKHYVSGYFETAVKKHFGIES